MKKGLVGLKNGKVKSYHDEEREHTKLKCNSRDWFQETEWEILYPSDYRSFILTSYSNGQRKGDYRKKNEGKACSRCTTTTIVIIIKICCFQKETKENIIIDSGISVRKERQEFGRDN